jgi:multidrug efflux system membrane fusion protein
MTVGSDDVVVAKVVVIGDLFDDMRVITDGLEPGDRVVVDGLGRAIPGRKVTPQLRQLAIKD